MPSTFLAGALAAGAGLAGSATGRRRLVVVVGGGGVASLRAGVGSGAGRRRVVVGGGGVATLGAGLVPPCALASSAASALWSSAESLVKSRPVLGVASGSGSGSGSTGSGSGSASTGSC